MKHIKLFEQFVTEKLNLSSDEFREYVKDIVAKKCPWAKVTAEGYQPDDFESIWFDNVVKIYWKEGPSNETNSMIRVRSDGRFQKNSDQVGVGEQVNKATGWDKQDIAIKNLLSILKTNSPNSPKYQ